MLTLRLRFVLLGIAVNALKGLIKVSDQDICVGQIFTHLSRAQQPQTTKMEGDGCKKWPSETEATEYLEKNKIVELFNNMTAQLIFHKPGEYNIDDNNA